MIKRTRVKGIAIVEFSIVVVYMLVLMFAIAEIAKYMFSMQLLNEVTRRAARLATVCFVSDQYKLVDTNVLTAVKPSGFNDGNLVIEYLDINGDLVPTSDFVGGRDANNANQQTYFTQIRYVKASIENYKYDFIFLPKIFGDKIDTQNYSTILPAESLGLYRPFGDGSSIVSDCGTGS